MSGVRRSGRVVAVLVAALLPLAGCTTAAPPPVPPAAPPGAPAADDAAVLNPLAVVQVGDRVTRGRQIARTGNSGNTTASHLHFHLMDSPLPLTATNIPFEIDRFTLDGSITPDALVSQPAPGLRTDQLP